MKIVALNRISFGLVVVVLFTGIQNNSVFSFQEASTVSSKIHETDNAFPEVLQRANDLFATFDQNCLKPVVKQQFMLEVARAFYETSQKTAPSNLRHEVAELTSDADFEKWLAEKWEDAGLQSVTKDESISVRDRISAVTVQQLDPRSRFVPAKENRVNKQLSENQYVGIGIRVRWTDDKAMIDDPFPGGAAHKAGAVPGDFIMEVDGKSMEGLDLGTIVDILRGHEGSTVSVVLQNKDGSEPRKLDMVRAVIPIPSVQGVRRLDDGTWQFMADKEPAFAYLNVSQVVGSTSAELKDAAQKILGRGAKGVVLDLRHATDGDLHHVNMITDVLCGKGEFGTLVLPSGQTRKLSSREHSDFEGLPIAVLSPASNVSGPIVALLTLLKRRHDTSIIGTPIQSDMTCLGSFDLPNNDGAISNLAYAKILPVIKHMTDSSGEVPSHQTIRAAQQLQFAPDQVEADDGKAIKVARDWLTEQSK